MIDQVISILGRLGKHFYIDDTETNINKLQVAKDHVAIVTSLHAIKLYDPEHPERISCILVNDLDVFLVIVKNRDTDLLNMISFWLNRSMKRQIAEDEFNCNVCFTDLKHKRGKRKQSIPFMYCATCNYVMCVKCLDKIQISENAHKCPQCNIWALSGEDYGVPKEELDMSLPQDFQTLLLAEKIATILSKLDGCTTVVARKDTTFANPRTLCRFSYTDRYSTQYDDTPMSIAKNLERFYKKSKMRNPSCIVRFYTVRMTYKIDKETKAPIKEVSAFKIASDQDLRQYAPDAWINVFEDDDLFTAKQVAYISPHEYALPKMYTDLTLEIGKYDCCKTVAIIHVKGNHTRVVVNFDVSQDNVITTLNPAALTAVIVDCHENMPEKAYVTCRLFPYDDTESADLLTYEWTSTSPEEGFKQVDSSRNRKLFHDNIDELKRSKFIKTFY